MSDRARLLRSTALSDVAEHAGATLDDVVRTTVHDASDDRRDLGTAWEVVRDAIAPHDPPSTPLGVAVLGYPDQLVEVDAVAVLRGPA